MLGKAYVYTQDWANAKTTLSDVIQHSGKTLMSYTKYANAFNGNSANEFNEESLFELNIDPDSKGGYGVYSGAANATSINGLIWCPWVLGGDGTEGGSFPLGYGNEFSTTKTCCVLVTQSAATTASWLTPTSMHQGLQATQTLQK